MGQSPPLVNSRSVAAGFGWVALCSYSNRILGLVSTLVLAKVLTPSDFGLVAVAAMMLEVIQLVKDMGLSEAVIYNKRQDRATLDTAHTILVGYNVLLFIGAAAAAPFIARFYDSPTLLPVVLLMSSTLVVNSLRVVPITLIRKNLDYRTLVVPEVVPVTVSALVSIAMALMGFGVWSLVIKSLIQSFMAVWLLNMVSSFRPRFGFDRAAARELLGYGRFVAGTSVLLVVLYNIDRFYVSSVVGIAALGVFGLAMQIAELPIRQFSFLVGAVMFPIMSTMERSGPALKNVFLKTLKYTASVTLPAAVGISIFGPSLMHALYGPRWDSIADPLRIVAVYAALRSLSSVIYDLYKATGNPHIMQRLCFFKLAMVGGLGIPALQAYGLVGMSALLVLTYGLSLVWELYELARILLTSYMSVVRVLIKPAALSVTVIPAVYWVATLLAPMESLWQVALAMVVAGFTYVGLLFAVDREASRDVKAFWSSKRVPAPQAEPSIL